MSQSVESPTKTFTAGAAIARFLRVALTAGKLAAAGSTTEELGTLQDASFADGDVRAVLLRTAQGTAKMVASEAITLGNPVYAASGGKIAASGTILLGMALESATANNDVIEILRRQAADTTSYNQTLTPAAADGAGNSIVAGVTRVAVGAVTTDANDYIVLPAIAAVPIGHRITILCSAGGNFEMRTPAASNTKINGQDCDGTKEYLCTDTQVIEVIKISDSVGWMAHAYSALGAVVTAVVPD